MKKILFIFDRVAHYHRDLFKELEIALSQADIELHLLSGRVAQGAVGRVGVEEKVILNEYKYSFKEHRLSTYTFRYSVGVFGFISAIKPDIVVCIAHVGNITHWGLCTLKSKLGFKLVAWQCGYEYNPNVLKRWLLRKFVPSFDMHLAYHSNARDYALAHGARSDQVVLMHNTINEERITSLQKPEARRFVVGKHPDIGSRKIILFVGAVLAEKRIEIVLAAMDLLAREDIVFVIVGDGEHLAAIRAACESRRNVIFAGAVVEGVGPYFDAAEMYVLPGTGGLGINEAMAHRLPIISGFADGSADDLVIDGVNGFRLREGTKEELADRMSKILDDPEVARRMGEKSCEWITGKFSFRQFVNRVTTALVAIV